MIKYAVLIFAIYATVESQRPPYAGNRRYPEVLPRFRDEANALTSTTTLSPSLSPSPGTGVGNRVGEETNNVNNSQGVVPASTSSPGVSTTVAPAVSTAATTPRDIPVHALGDTGFVDVIQTWPEDSQPFWWLNRKQINEHLHPNNPDTVVRPGTETRSFFAGKK